MTDRTEFSDEEWDLLIGLPRWVARAAVAAERDSKRRTRVEVEAGFVAVANGRKLGSPLVASIAREAMDIYDDAGGIDFSKAEAGIAAAIEKVTAAVAVLVAKADEAERAIYAKWVVTVADDVILASRTGDRFGIGGHAASSAELRFKAKLDEALRPLGPS